MIILFLLAAKDLKDKQYGFFTNGKHEVLCVLLLSQSWVSFSAVETERVLGVIASMMAVIAICLCLLFSFCWDPYTYSESKMNPGRIRHPEKLLLTVLMPTGKRITIN